MSALEEDRKRKSPEEKVRESGVRDDLKKVGEQKAAGMTKTRPSETTVAGCEEKVATHCRDTQSAETFCSILESNLPDEQIRQNLKRLGIAYFLNLSYEDLRMFSIRLFKRQPPSDHVNILRPQVLAWVFDQETKLEDRTGDDDEAASTQRRLEESSVDAYESDSPSTSILHQHLPRPSHLVSTISSDGGTSIDVNVDILCFGRAGCGKSTLLSAISGRTFESHAGVEEKTLKL